MMDGPAQQSGDARTRGVRFTSVSGGNQRIRFDARPSPELATLDDRDLVVQRVARDERIAILFRKWPKLASRELQELRRLYDERLRLARHFGRIRRRRR